MKKRTTIAYIIGALAIISTCEANNKPDETLEATYSINQPSFIPSQPNVIAIRSATDNKVHLLDIATGKDHKKPFAFCSSFVPNKHGTKIAVSNNSYPDPAFEIWDINNPTKKATLQKKIMKKKNSTADYNKFIAFAHNDTKLITTDNLKNNIILLNIETGKQIKKPIKLKHNAIAFNSSSNALASFHKNERVIKIHILDVEEHKLIPTEKVIPLKDLDLSIFFTKKLQFNTTGSALGFMACYYSSTKNMQLSIYSLDSEKLTKNISQSYFTDFAFGQHNNRKAVIASSGKNIHFWYQDMLTLKELVIQCILKNKINTKNIPPLLLKI